MLLKRHVRHSKYDPFVDEVELLNANPNYALERFPSGKEDTVSIRDLVSCVRDVSDDKNSTFGNSQNTPGNESDTIDNSYDSSDNVHNALNDASDSQLIASGQRSGYERWDY